MILLCVFSLHYSEPDPKEVCLPVLLCVRVERHESVRKSREKHVLAQDGPVRVCLHVEMRSARRQCIVPPSCRGCAQVLKVDIELRTKLNCTRSNHPPVVDADQPHVSSRGTPCLDSVFDENLMYVVCTSANKQKTECNAMKTQATTTK